MHQVWQSTLPTHIFDELRDDDRIEVVEGDICERNLGLDADTVAQLKATVNIVIHAASSINLRHSLAKIAPIIVQGTLNVANFATECRRLERFVYISSSYTNAHLHHLHPKEICQVSERIYPLVGENDSHRDAEAEWLDLQKYGTTAEYESNSFPWSYAYAKHLTERLLQNVFQENTSSSSSITSPLANSVDLDSKQKLLIVRPSIIGPAETYPSPGWQVAASAPVTGLLSFLILAPSKLHFYSQFDDPSHEAMIDEIPVDIVANRIIMHIFVGTSSIVHANRDLSDCYSFGDYVGAVQPLRRLPWKTNIAWQHDWKSTKLCWVAKLYQVGGCTFDFRSQKTSNLWSVMASGEREIFPLFTTVGYSNTGSTIDMTSRDEAFRRLISGNFKRRKWPGWVLPILYNKC